MGSSGYDSNSLAKSIWDGSRPILGRWMALIFCLVFWLGVGYAIARLA